MGRVDALRLDNRRYGVEEPPVSTAVRVVTSCAVCYDLDARAGAGILVSPLARLSSIRRIEVNGRIAFIGAFRNVLGIVDQARPHVARATQAGRRVVGHETRIDGRMGLVTGDAPSRRDRPVNPRVRNLEHIDGIIGVTMHTELIDRHAQPAALREIGSR